MVKSKGPEFSESRQWAVILEDLRSQFRSFGEGLDDVRDKVEMILATKADKSDFELLKIALAHQQETLSQQQEILSQKADKADVQKLQTSFDRFFHVLNDHEGRISTLEKSS